MRSAGSVARVLSMLPAAMTLPCGLADDLRIDAWLIGHTVPVDHESAGPNYCWLGPQLAPAEMIRTGTTCFADICYHEEAIAGATPSTSKQTTAIVLPAFFITSPPSNVRPPHCAAVGPGRDYGIGLF